MARSTTADTPTTTYLDWLAGAPLASPSPLAWDAMTAHIAQHPPRSSEVTLLEAALERWPDALRIAPDSWVVAASRSKNPPAYWSLARAVRYQYAELTPAKVRWLLTSPSMRGIRHLAFQHYAARPLRAAILEGLANSQALSGLKTLDLFGCGLGWAALKVVLSATWLSSLECLNLDQRFMTLTFSQHQPEAAVQLRGALHLATLTSLRVNLLAGQDVLEVVLSAPHLAGLTTLHLGASSCSDALIRRMVADPRRWQALALEGEEVSSAGACLMAEHLGALESLALTGPIGMEGVLALLDSDRLPALRNLVLRNTEVADADAPRLSAHPRAAQLEHFSCDSKRLSQSVVVSRQ